MRIPFVPTIVSRNTAAIVCGPSYTMTSSQPRTGLGDERRLDILEHECLLGDRIDDAPVAVTDVDRHELAVEVEDPLPVGRVEVDALRVVDRDRVDGALDGPGEERVLTR